MAATIDPDGYERARACEPCRLSKVRCDQPDPNRPCKRCAKSWRECIPATRSQPSKTAPAQSQLSLLEDRVHSLITLCQREQNNEVLERVNGLWASESAFGWRTRPGFHSHRPGAGPIQAPRHSNTTSFVETGISQIVDHAEADRLFHCYCTEMAVTFPAVVFGPAVSAAQVRLSSPLLFLAVITSAARAVSSVEVQARLRVLLFHVLESCTVNSGEYTLELLQAVVVSALWYIPAPQDIMTFEQLCYTAMEIAAYLRSRTAHWTGTEAQHLEARRAWLASYYLETVASMRSSNPSRLRSNAHAEECMGVLTSSPLAQTGDLTLCYYLSLQQITLDYSQRLKSTSPIPSSIEVQEVLDNFNRAILTREQSTIQRNRHEHEPSMEKPIASILYHASRVCIYEAAINHANFSNNRLNNENQHPHCLFSSQEQSLVECLQSAHHVISEFTFLGQREIQVLPTVVLLRVIHATVVLVTLIISISKSCSLGCHATRTQEMRVDQALDEMISIMTGWQSTWPATKWTRILLRLRKRLRESQRGLISTQSQSPGNDRNPCWSRTSTSTSSATLSPFDLPTWDLPSPLSAFPLFHESSVVDEHSLDPSALVTNCLVPETQETSFPLTQEDGTIPASDLTMAQLLTDSLSVRTIDADLSMLESSLLDQVTSSG